MPFLGGQVSVPGSGSPITPLSERSTNDSLKRTTFKPLLHLGTRRFRHVKVTGLCFSPDAKNLASAGTDGTIRIWDPSTGEELSRCVHERDSFNSLAYCPDGKTIVSIGGDGVLRRWDTATRKQFAPLEHGTGCSGALAMPRSGDLIAAARLDAAIGIWDLGSHKLVTKLQGHSTMVVGLCFSADAKRLVSVSKDNTVRFWDVPSGKELRSYPVHRGRITAVTLSDNGQTIACGLHDPELLESSPIICWDAIIASPSRRVLTGHGAPVTRLAFSSDGWLLVSGSKDKTIRLWALGSGRVVKMLEGHCGSICGLSLTKDGKILASAANDGVIRLWDIGKGIEIVATEGHQGPVRCVGLSVEHSLIASGGDDGTVRLWDLKAAKEIAKLAVREKCLATLCFSADGNALASVGTSFRVFDTLKRKEVRSFQLLATPCDSCAALSSSWSDIAVSDFAFVRVMAAKGAFWPRTFMSQDLSAVRGLAFSPDSKMLAVASDHVSRGVLVGGAEVWAIETGKQAFSASARVDEEARCIAFGTDGHTLAFGSNQGLYLGDIRKEGELRRIGTERMAATALAFSPDGRMLASGDEVGTVHLWEVVTGRERGRLIGHAGDITCLAFDTQGAQLVSGSMDTTVILWDLAGTGGPKKLKKLKE
jgi:WD40 repeat protein